MKTFLKKTGKLVKGAPTGVLVSFALHGLLLLFAAGWVVFTIIERQEQKFVPEQVKRPEMQLKKLRVKVKESSKPRRSSERIMAARRTAAMPDIQLPAMTGMGSGLAGSVGGFEMMADLAGMTLMGAGRSLGNDFEGTFYYFPWDRNGNRVEGMSVEDGDIHPPVFMAIIDRFLESDWDPAVFDQVYRAPAKLYATQFMVPPSQSYTAPPKFGIKEATNSNFQACLWAVHYQGKIASPTGGRYRFWGYADDFMIVRVNRTIVLDAHHYSMDGELKSIDWESSAPEHKKYRFCNSYARVGDWFELKPGESAEMEILVSEVPGGGFAMMLLVQEEGVEYAKTESEMPILPIFKTMPTPPHLLDEIEYLLPEGQADLEGGPVFRAF